MVHLRHDCQETCKIGMHVLKSRLLSLDGIETWFLLCYYTYKIRVCQLKDVYVIAHVHKNMYKISQQHTLIYNVHHWSSGNYGCL